MLEVRQARYFVAVAEELHFGRAAARLQIAQPPLSAAIRRLETQLGAQLLHRTSRSVTLTPPGGALLDEARALLAQADRATAAVRLAATGQQGRVAVGCVASALYELLPAALAHFTARFPHVELAIREVDTAEAPRQLIDRRLDLALIRLDRDQDGLLARPLRREPLLVAIPISHPLAPRETVELAALADDSWVTVPRTVSPPYHDQLLAACRLAGFSPRAHHTARSIETQIAMVACGLGTALVPTSTARLHLPGVIYRPLTNPVELVELAAVTRDEAPAAPTGALLDSLEAASTPSTATSTKR